MLVSVTLFVNLSIIPSLSLPPFDSSVGKFDAIIGREKEMPQFSGLVGYKNLRGRTA